MTYETDKQLAEKVDANPHASATLQHYCSPPATRTSYVPILLTQLRLVQPLMWTQPREYADGEETCLSWQLTTLGERVVKLVEPLPQPERQFVRPTPQDPSP